MKINIRKFVTYTETIQHDGGPVLDHPCQKGAIAAVIENPYAGVYEPELTPWMDSLKPLALEMSDLLLQALKADIKDIQNFGKGAIVGAEGEIEHAAVWHAPGGHGMKQKLNAVGFVSSCQMMGAMGTSMHIPMVYINSPWVRSHFDAVDITISDAPKPNEIIFALAMGTGPRIHARLGGLTVEQVLKGEGPSF